MHCWEVAEQGFQPRLPKGSRTQTGSRQLAEPSEDWTLSVPKALGTIGDFRQTKARSESYL